VRDEKKNTNNGIGKKKTFSKTHHARTRAKKGHRTTILKSEYLNLELLRKLVGWGKGPGAN